MYVLNSFVLKRYCTTQAVLHQEYVALFNKIKENRSSKWTNCLHLQTGLISFISVRTCKNTVKTNVNVWSEKPNLSAVIVPFSYGVREHSQNVSLHVQYLPCWHASYLTVWTAKCSKSEQHCSNRTCHIPSWPLKHSLHVRKKFC